MKLPYQSVPLSCVERAQKAKRETFTCLNCKTTREKRRYSRERLPPCYPGAETPSVAPTPFFQASNRETDETYVSVVAVLNGKLRVICGSCRLQWIVQKRKNPLTWVSFAYSATKEGLLLRLPKDGHGCDPEAWAVIAVLPDYFPRFIDHPGENPERKPGTYQAKVQGQPKQNGRPHQPDSTTI